MLIFSKKADNLRTTLTNPVTAGLPAVFYHDTDKTDSADKRGQKQRGHKHGQLFFAIKNHKSSNDAASSGFSCGADNTDKRGQIKNLSTGINGKNADRHGHHPIGVSCPVRLSMPKKHSLAKSFKA